MRKKVYRSALSLIVLLVCGLSTGHATIKIGVNAHQGPEYVMNRWSELGKYLSAQLGQPVIIEPLQVSSLLADVKRKKIDFVLANPVQTVTLEEYFRTVPLVTLNTKSGSQFAGVIVTKKGSGIRTSDDLRGKKVMSMRFKAAAGGYIFQTYHLLQRGINPHTDFASMKQVKSQVTLVRAVERGIIDAAFIRSGLLEKMAQAGKIDIDDFTIVDAKEPNDVIPFAHTTDAYPEWYLSAMPTTDGAIVEQLQAALLKLTPASPATQIAKIKGFVKPLPLDGLQAALKTLKAPPYNR